ncbi:hypothetical protein Dimus_014399 [Dionaea muscipula]
MIESPTSAPPLLPTSAETNPHQRITAADAEEEEDTTAWAISNQFFEELHDAKGTPVIGRAGT